MKKVTNKVDVGRNALTDEAIVKNSLVVQRNPITFYAEGDGDTPTLNAILDAPSIMDDAEPQETPETPTETPNETTSQESTETPTTETPDSQTTETPEGESEQALKAFAEQAGGVDVNDKGELVDAEGKVVKTAEETEAALKEYNDNISQENAPFIDSFQRLMGYEIKDQQGNLVSYEDTEKGLIDYTKAVIDQQTYKTQQEFLDSIPGIREYAEFMNRGGSPKEYFERYVAPQTNWRGIQVEEGEQHETKHYNIVKSALMARGFNEERAIQQTDLIKDLSNNKKNNVLNKNNKESKLHKKSKRIIGMVFKKQYKTEL
jgi:predicted GIY-YIG superfamily endonuclease